MNGILSRNSTSLCVHIGLGCVFQSALTHPVDVRDTVAFLRVFGGCDKHGNKPQLVNKDRISQRLNLQLNVNMMCSDLKTYTPYNVQIDSILSVTQPHLSPSLDCPPNLPEARNFSVNTGGVKHG